MQKRHGCITSALAAALLQGCGGGTSAADSGIYAVPLEEAFVRLEKADIDGFRTARQCGVLIHIAQAAEGTDGITWRVTSSGKPVARFTVRLTAEGPGTRATIEVPAAPDGGEIYDGSKFYPRPALHQPLRPAIKELVDAAIEQRPYDVWKLTQQPRTDNDRVCAVQHGSLTSGRPFRVDDIPSMTSDETAHVRADKDREREQEARDFGKPMLRPGDL